MQKQINYLTVAVLIASLTMCGYFWRQQRVTKNDLNNFKVGATQILTAYQKDKPQFEAFVARVIEYGAKHPDFAPIMTKYRIGVNTGAPPAGVVAPTAAPAKAK